MAENTEVHYTKSANRTANILSSCLVTIIQFMLQ